MFKIFTFCVAVMLPVIVFSQKTFISLGPELSVPGSSISMDMFAGTGFGGSLRIESSWGKHISGMASIGYLGFAEQHPYSYTPATTSKINVILFQPGLKYYFQVKEERPKGFFISAEVGLMIVSTLFHYEVNTDSRQKETGLSCATGMGYQLGKLETSFRLQYNLSESGLNIYYYNFRVAYAFLKGKR